MNDDRSHPRLHATGRRAAAASLLLALLGCPNIPPSLDRTYLRVGSTALFEPLAADGDRAIGPYIGVTTSLGALLAIEGTRATALEVELQGFELNAGDLDGWGMRYLGGPRWIWNFDGRLRPTIGVGGSWTDFRLAHRRRGRDPGGVGVYGDAGLDWMLTPRIGIGARLRTNVRYEEADREHTVRDGIEFALQSVWRF